MKRNIQILRNIISIVFLVFLLSDLDAQTTTYDFSSGVTGLNEASPGILLDANIGFGSFKNSGTADPGIFSSQLRLYQNTTKGGSIKVYANNGVTITQLVVNASGTTGSAKYLVDGGGSTSVSYSGGSYTMSGLSATSYVEFYCASSTRIYVDDFEVTYSAGSSPTITLSESALSGFTYVEGSGPSSEQSFTVSGDDLTANVMLTPPTNYEISTGTGGGFSATNPITLTQSGGDIDSEPVTIYVRLKSGLSEASYNNEDIDATSTDATTQSVTCSGSVTGAPDPEPTNHCSSFSAASNGSSQIDLTWADNDGAQAAAGFLIKANTSGTFTGPSDGTDPAEDTDLSDGSALVKVAHGTQAHSFTGLSSSTQYYFKVWSYTNSSTDIDFKTDGTVPTDDATTDAGPITIVYQDFAADGGDWNFTEDPSEFNLSGDVWDEVTSSFHTFGTIPSSGSYFWGVEDINCPSGTSDWATLTFEQVNISAYTNVQITFDYEVDGYDSGDDIKYEYFEDGISQGEILLVDGYSNLNQDATVTIDIDDAAVSCSLIVSVKQNGSDYGSFDNFRLSGVLNTDPEIHVTQATTDYNSGSTYDFGTVGIGSNSDVVFTINNEGGGDLTLSNTTVTGDAVFSLQTTPVSPISGSSSTSCTVRFLPSAQTSYTGVLTITSNDSDEGTYTINLSGNGGANDESDITEFSGYNFTENIDYTSYSGNPITSTSNSVGVFKFTIRDGGSDNTDADSYPTILDDITFSSVSGIDNILDAALFNGNAKIASATSISGTDIIFTNLPTTGDYTKAADEGTIDLTLRVSFKQTSGAITDNDVLSFTITNSNVAEGTSSSGFSSFSSVTSSQTGDENKLEVTASQIEFTTQPLDGTTSTNLDAFAVSAVDANNNLDLDESSCTIALITSGTGMSSSTPYTFSNGVVTLSDVQFSSAQSSITITATAQSCLGNDDVTSSIFNITQFTYQTNDWRPTGDYVDFSHNGNWEVYDGSSWAAPGDGKAPQNTSETINRIIIHKEGITAGGNTTNTYPDIYILNGADLTLSDSDPTPAVEFLNSRGVLEVQSGGTLFVDGDIDLPSDAEFNVQADAYVYINNADMTNDHPMWDGIETFAAGSFIEINDWNWGASATVRSLMNISTSISDNAEGYKFGYLTMNGTPTDTWTLIGGGIGVINLCYNDLVIDNASNYYVGGASNRTGTNGFVINGDLIIRDGDFIFSTTYSSDAFDHQFTINGDFIFNGDDDLYMHKNCNSTASSHAGKVTFKGDVYVGADATMLKNEAASDNDLMYIDFDGGTTQLLTVGPTTTGVPMNVKGGAIVQLDSCDLTYDGIVGLTNTFTVESGAGLHFGWAQNGTTPLKIVKPGSSNGSPSFSTESNSTLYITHSEGIDDGTDSKGNVQLSASNKTFNQTATFYYIGKEDQEVGDAITSGSTAKLIVVDMANDTDALTLTNCLAVSDGTTISGTGGKIDIRSGIVTETETAYFSSCSGTIYMSGGGYVVAYNSQDASDYIPRMTGSTYEYNLTGGTIYIAGDGSQIVRGGKAYYNLTFTNAGTKTISSAIKDIAGTVTINDANVTVDVENNSFGTKDASFNNRETNFTMSAGTFQATKLNTELPEFEGVYDITGGTVRLYGTASNEMQRLKGSSAQTAQIKYYNVTLDANVANHTYGEANIDLGSSIYCENTFLLNSPAVFKMDNTDIIYDDGTGDFAMESGSTLLYGHDRGLDTDGLDGNIQLSGTITLVDDGTGNYGFCSTGDMITGDMPASVNDLYVYRSDNVSKTIISQDITAGGDLNFGGGKMQLDVYDLTITGDITGEDENKYVITNTDYDAVNKGFLIRNVGAAEKEFPVGNGTTYTPCYITNSGTIRAFNIRVFEGVYEHGLSGNLLESPIENFVNRTWEITPDGAGVDATVELQWNVASDEGVDFNNTLVYMLKNQGTDWIKINDVADAATINSDIATFSQNNITSFSKFTVGDDDIVLPIELLSFNATCKNSIVALDWITTTEINNDYFVIEKSLNGQDFTPIATVLGNGTSYTTHYYTTIDENPNLGINYYRLKQIDYNGEYTYSDIVSIDVKKNENKVIVYENNSDCIVINSSEFREILEVRIVDVLGKEIYIKKIINESLPIYISKSELITGIYYVQCISNTEIITKKIYVR